MRYLATILLFAASLAAQDPHWIQKTAKGSITAADAACTARSCTWIVAPFDTQWASVQLAGAFHATLQFESSVNGTDWAPIAASDGSTSAAAQGIWSFQLAGRRFLRVRASAYATGPVVVSISTAESNSVSETIWTDDGTTVRPPEGRIVASRPTIPGATSGGTLSAPNKFTITSAHAAFKAAANEVLITLGQLPANAQITALRMKHSEEFAGTGITAVACSLGDGTDHTIYSPEFDVVQAVGDTVMHQDGGAYAATAAAHDLVLYCAANANFGDGDATALTAGSLDIWLSVAVLGCAGRSPRMGTAGSRGVVTTSFEVTSPA